jgi:type IV pilus assembly protein PilQ
MPKKVVDLVKTAKTLDAPGMKDFLRLETAVIPVKNTQATQLVNLIREKLSPEAVIKTDDNLNTLIITDVKSKIDLARELIAQLDMPVRQVMIEVKIVELQNGTDSKLGLDWRSILQSAQATAGSINLLNKVSIKSDSANKSDSGSNNKNSSDFSQNGYYQANSLKAAMNVQGLDTILGILINDGKGRIISSPRIVGSNNKTASINDGEQIFYTTDNRSYSNNISDNNQVTSYAGSATPSTSTIVSGNLGSSRNVNGGNYINAGISLNVTPHIVTDDLVTLDIDANINNLTGWSPSGGPIIASRSANSTITIKNGEMFVMGGLKKNEVVKSADRWPVLGYIPVLDFFFASQKEVKVSNDVVIFIIPTILKELGKSSTQNDSDILEKMDKEEKQ